MRPPSSASSAGGHLSLPSDPSNRQHCPPLPDRFVAGLHSAFQLLDIKGTGKISYEQICKKWPIQFAEAPVPSNFLECLRRVNPNEEMVTFEHFIKGAQVALRERMSTAGRLKRVQSEGKLFGDENGNGKSYECNRSKNRTPSTTPGPHPLRSNGHPSMGLSGRKMDGRGSGDADQQFHHRLVRLKRASRSQPQLNELFDGQKNEQRGTVRRNELVANDNDGNDVKIVYRSKKYKAPAPPPQSKEKNKNNNDNRRPISVASTVISTMMPSPPLSTITYNNGIHKRQNSENQNNCTNNYSDELQPQVAKHERLLEEEFEIVKMGTKKAQELMDWYADRNESLEKRKRMLKKGMVALDSAIHEQRLNFHRAQIAEVNRRIANFLASSERGGFPSHNNVIGSNNNNNSTTQQHSINQQIRSQVLPPPFPSCYSSVPNSSSNCSSSSSSSTASSAPDSVNFGNASEAEFLRAQNQKLTRDIKMLAREVEQLRVERCRQPPPSVVAAVASPYHHQHCQQQQNQKMNFLNAVAHQQHRRPNDYLMMWHGVPVPNSNGFPSFHASPKDTLL